jgi:hypothetical protein
MSEENNMTRYPGIFPTMKELEAATPEEQILWGTLFLRWARNNYEEKIAADTAFDRSEKLEPWLDEYTSRGDDAERIRSAGRLTSARINPNRKEHDE